MGEGEYVYRPYPKMLYTSNGERCVVNSPEEHDARLAEEGKIWGGRNGPWKKQRRRDEASVDASPPVKEPVAPVASAPPAVDPPPPRRRRRNEFKP